MVIVGLPIFLNLSKTMSVTGFDINEERIIKLNKYIDIYKEFKKDELKLFKKNKSVLSSNIKDIKDLILFYLLSLFLLQYLKIKHLI